MNSTPGKASGPWISSAITHAPCAASEREPPPAPRAARPGPSGCAGCRAAARARPPRTPRRARRSRARSPPAAAPRPRAARRARCRRSTADRHGGVDDHAVARRRQYQQQLLDADHHVAHQRRPAPDRPSSRAAAPRSPRTPSSSPSTSPDVAEVAELDRRAQRGLDRRRELEVHLGHPRRQHVRRVRRPLLAAALAAQAIVHVSPA